MICQLLSIRICLQIAFTLLMYEGWGSVVMNDGFSSTSGLECNSKLNGDLLPKGAIARMGSTRFRPGSAISDLAYSDDGAILIACANNRIDLWSSGSGKLVQRFDNFSIRRRDVPIEMAYPFAVSPDMKHVASGGADGRIRIHEFGNSKCVLEWNTPGAQQFFGRRLAIRQLRFSPDGKAILSVEHTGVVRLWNVSSGEELAVISDPLTCFHAVEFSSRGDFVAYAHVDRSIRLCSCLTGKELIRFPAQFGSVARFKFSPDDKSVAVVVIEGSSDKGLEAAVRIYDVNSGKALSCLDGNDSGTPISFSPDGTLLATTKKGAIQISDMITGKLRLQFGDQSHVSPSRISALAFSKDGKKLASCGTDQVIHEWDSTTGNELFSTRGHQARLLAAAFSPDNQVLASASEDRTIRLWDIHTGKEFRKHLISRIDGVDLRTGAQLRFTPNGRRLIACMGGSRLHSWIVSDGRELCFQLEKGHTASCFSVSLDGNRLVVAGIVDVPGRPFPSTIVSLWDCTSACQIRQFERTSSLVCQIGISSDGSSVLGVGTDAQKSSISVVEWDAANGRLKREQFVAVDKSTFSVTSAVTLSMAGQYLACARFDPTSLRSGTVICTFDRGANGRSRIVRSPSRIRDALSFGPACRTISAFEQDGVIHSWELATGKERRTLIGHSGAGRMLAFSNDWAMLASGGDDTSILIWDMRYRDATELAVPTDVQLNKFWSNLSSDDALLAEQAILGLLAGGDRALDLICDHLRPAREASDRDIASLVERLDDKSLSVRSDATLELSKLGMNALPALGRVITGPLSLECRRRIESFIDSRSEEVRNPGGEQVRAIRALEILERFHSAKSRTIVLALSQGTSSSWLTQEAIEVLDRWNYHSLRAQ